MAFDSVVMSAVVAELSARLAGGRISRVFQPQPDELALLIYAGGKNHRLLISANARFARIHLSRVEKRNPPIPPTFCMLMRKYIEGGRILAVRQPGRERICRLHIGVTDELGNPAEFVLVAEIMSKHSNVVLVGPQGRIVDAIRRVSEEVNRYRELLPGLPYVPPPPLGKTDPTALTPQQFGALTDPPALAWQVVLDRVDGLSPLLAREVIARAGFAAEAPWPAVSPQAEAVVAAARLITTPPDAYAPALLYDREGTLKDFHVLPLQHWPGQAQGSFDSPSACIDAFFGCREGDDRLAALRGSLTKLVRDEAVRVRRKLTLQQAALTSAENAEDLRVTGELITANLWQIHNGDAEAVVSNYYDPEGGVVRIELDPALSPSENAQLYYHRYQKARSGRTAIIAQLEKSRGEVAYLDQVEAMLREAAALPELAEIRAELQSEGYIGEKKARREAPPRSGGGGRDEKAAPPLTLLSSDGLEIWVGRNNRQNDYLTLKLAAPGDLWFHTKDIPGSHVILRVPPGREIPELAVHEAAALAAYHSKGRESASVPVDYTARKHVRKPAGAKPGMVIYEHQKTLWVTPDPELNPILKRHHTGQARARPQGGDIDGSGETAGPGDQGDPVRR